MPTINVVYSDICFSFSASDLMDETKTWAWLQSAVLERMTAFIEERTGCEKGTLELEIQAFVPLEITKEQESLPLEEVTTEPVMILVRPESGLVKWSDIDLDVPVATVLKHENPKQEADEAPASSSNSHPSSEPPSAASSNPAPTSVSPSNPNPTSTSELSLASLPLENAELKQRMENVAAQIRSILATPVTSSTRQRGQKRQRLQKLASLLVKHEDLTQEADEAPASSSDSHPSSEHAAAASSTPAPKSVSPSNPTSSLESLQLENTELKQRMENVAAQIRSILATPVSSSTRQRGQERQRLQKLAALLEKR